LARPQLQRLVLSRKTGKDEEGREICEILCGFKPLFELLFHQKSRPEEFYTPSLKPKVGGGWLLDAELKNMRILLNPSIFPVDTLKHFRKLPADIYKQIEAARVTLSAAEGKKRP